MTVARTGLFTTEPDYHDNRIVNSLLFNYQSVDRSSRQLSIKYVSKGVERYAINNHTHSVGDKHLLITSKDSYIETTLDSEELVIGVCFFLDENFIEDVRRNSLLNDSALLDDPAGYRRYETGFFEECYHEEENVLGKYVSAIGKQIAQRGVSRAIDPGVYYTLAEKLIQLHHKTAVDFSKLDSVKYSTRKELLRRIRLATRLLDERLTIKCDMGLVARDVSLSEFHFFRTFKKIHGVTPYQYQLQRRLSMAFRLLQQKGISVSEAAVQTGFADIQSFSKAFKKNFKMNPSAFANATGIPTDEA